MSDEIYLISSASFDEVRRSRRPDGVFSVRVEALLPGLNRTPLVR